MGHRQMNWTIAFSVRFNLWIVIKPWGLQINQIACAFIVFYLHLVSVAAATTTAAAITSAAAMESWPLREFDVEQSTKPKANIAKSEHVDVCRIWCVTTMRWHYVTNEISTQHIFSWQSTRSKCTASWRQRRQSSGYGRARTKQSHTRPHRHECNGRCAWTIYAISSEFCAIINYLAI